MVFLTGNPEDTHEDEMSFIMEKSGIPQVNKVNVMTQVSIDGNDSISMYLSTSVDKNQVDSCGSSHIDSNSYED